MIKELLTYWPAYALSILFSVICETIYYVLHRKEKQGTELSELQTQWMLMAKMMRIGFLILPVVLIVLLPLVEKAFGIVAVIFIAGVFLLELYKGKKI